MGSDSELSMAFSNSLKAAVIPRLNTQGHFFTEGFSFILLTKQRYIVHRLKGDPTLSTISRKC